MNAEACTLIAQTIPVLLLASSLFDHRVAKFVATYNKSVGMRIWSGLGVVLPLAAVLFAIQGVNEGGLSGWRLELTMIGVVVMLVYVAVKVVFISVAPSHMQEKQGQ